MLERRKINNKDVFIVEAHHEVISAWGEIFNELGRSPIVITLDYHTDCYDAFVRYSFHKFEKLTGREPTYEERVEQSRSDVASYDIRNKTSLLDAVEKLHNDEHISFSTMAGIVDHVLAIATSASGSLLTKSEEYKTWNEFINRKENIRYKLGLDKGMPRPEDKTYIVPENKIFLFATDIDLSQFELEDRDIKRRDSVIESSIISQHIQKYKIAATSAGIETIDTCPYILDIDLDVFNTSKSLQPNDATAFYKLIRDAYAITIATEPEWVEKCRLHGEEISSQTILSRLIEHIEIATS